MWGMTEKEGLSFRTETQHKPFLKITWGGLMTHMTQHEKNGVSVKNPMNKGQTHITHITHLFKKIIEMDRVARKKITHTKNKNKLTCHVCNVCQASNDKALNRHTTKTVYVHGVSKT